MKIKLLNDVEKRKDAIKEIKIQIKRIGKNNFRIYIDDEQIKESILKYAIVSAVEKIFEKINIFFEDIGSCFCENKIAVNFKGFEKIIEFSHDFNSSEELCQEIKNIVSEIVEFINEVEGTLEKDEYEDVLIFEIE